MSPADYTSNTIQHVRDLARQGWPHGAVAAQIGWDLPRLQRFAEKHQIRFVQIEARSKTPDPVKAKIRWDHLWRKAWHGHRSIKITSPSQALLFEAIVNAAEHSPEHEWTVEELSKVAGVRRRSVAGHISALRDQLECIGLTLTRRKYEIVRV